MRITMLLRGRSTLDQYLILMRADGMFGVGRFFGGELTKVQILVLMEGLK